MKKGASLDPVRSGLLYRLWKRQRDGDGTLATANELHKALLDDGYREHDVRSVKRALERLEKYEFVQSAPVSRATGHPGPPPTGYKIAPDPSLITRKSTAQIVLRLLHHPGGMVPEQVFIKDVLEMNLRRDDTGIALTHEDLRNQVEWCVTQGYIRVSEKANDPENPGRQRRLCATPKVHGELLLLERICPRKGPVSVDRPFPNALENVDKVAG